MVKPSNEKKEDMSKYSVIERSQLKALKISKYDPICGLLSIRFNKEP